MNKLTPVLYYWNDNYAVIDEDSYVLFLNDEQYADVENDDNISNNKWYDDVKKISTLELVEKYAESIKQ